jgi:putative glycosyltransferase
MTIGADHRGVPGVSMRVPDMDTRIAGSAQGGYAVRPQMSIVTTVYKSRRFLDEYIKLCDQALAEIRCTEYELVFVNDGSPDDSLDYLLSEKASRSGVVIVDLSRNFGHHQAAHTGLSVSTGELVFIIDCDLEVSPMVLVTFYRRMMAESCDVVYGFQEKRKGGPFEQSSGAVFWKLFNLVSDVPVPANILTERLMSRRYVEGLLDLGDKNLFLAGMMHWAGFKQIGLPVQKKQREGASTYGFFRKISLMVDAITSFSSRPLVWLFHFGVTITAASFLYGLYLVVRKLLYQEQIELGFTTIAGLIALSLGAVTTCLGVIGIYLAKVYNQVRGRPIVLIRDIYR